MKFQHIMPQVQHEILQPWECSKEGDHPCNSNGRVLPLAGVYQLKRLAEPQDH
jgi:hypothetical protein